MNFRIPPELDDLVEEAVEISGAPTRSAFARDCLEAGARREISERDRRQQARTRRTGSLVTVGAGATLGGGFTVVPGRCLHPVTAIKTDRPDVDYCSLCSTVTRVKS